MSLNEQYTQYKVYKSNEKTKYLNTIEYFIISRL